jgi:hypothetical protein
MFIVTISWILAWSLSGRDTTLVVALSYVALYAVYVALVFSQDWYERREAQRKARRTRASSLEQELGAPGTVAGLALAILLDLGRSDADEAGAETRIREMIAALPPRTRSAAVAQIAEAASAERLAGAAPFIASLIALPEVAGDAKARALGSLLVLSPDHGYPVFAAEVEADRSQLALLRQAAILLASGVRAPETEWKRVRNGDPLLETIADAGVLLAQSDDAGAFGKLVGLRHRVAMRAALEEAIAQSERKDSAAVLLRRHEFLAYSAGAPKMKASPVPERRSPVSCVNVNVFISGLFASFDSVTSPSYHRPRRHVDRSSRSFVACCSRCSARLAARCVWLRRRQLCPPL